MSIEQCCQHSFRTVLPTFILNQSQSYETKNFWKITDLILTVMGKLCEKYLNYIQIYADLTF